MAGLVQGHGAEELGAEPAREGRPALPQAEVSPDHANLSREDVSARPTPHSARADPALRSEVPARLGLSTAAGGSKPSSHETFHQRGSPLQSLSWLQGPSDGPPWFSIPRPPGNKAAGPVFS